MTDATANLAAFRARARLCLIAALLALSATYVAWFAGKPRPWVALAVFALPPLLLAIGVIRRQQTAGFWAGVLALGWFSHGVMVAWSRPAEQGYAWTALLLAVAIVFASSLPGMRARFAGKRG